MSDFRSDARRTAGPFGQPSKQAARICAYHCAAALACSAPGVGSAAGADLIVLNLPLDARADVLAPVAAAFAPLA